MASVIEQHINYSLLCLSKLVFMKHGFKYNNETIDSQGTIITEYEKKIKHSVLIFVFGWDRILSVSITKHYQIMISEYVNNGQLINRNEFDKGLFQRMREVLPPMLMKHDLLLSSNSFTSHTCVYFDFSIKHKVIGRMVFRLYNNVPQTTENFRSLCVGDKHLCYVGRGDITNFDGSSGECIYGITFADENFNNKHSKPGTLSMINFGPNTNNSQFFITYIGLPFFDDTYVKK
ncbi:unnamed protein product [Rotaria sp. Silwood2]|nr:unnamed protein product [Rotaria sp. Silwood2]